MNPLKTEVNDLFYTQSSDYIRQPRIEPVEPSAQVPTLLTVIPTISQVAKERLEKSAYTRKLEQGIKEIIKSFDQVKIDRFFGKLYIKIGGEYFDLIDLMQNSNCSHFTFDDQDYQNLERLYKEDPKSKKSLKKANKNKFYMQSQFGFVKQDSKHLHDRLEDGSTYVYTLPDYFKQINSLMKGQIEEGLNQEQIKLTLIHIGMICSGIQRNLSIVPQVTRVEKSETGLYPSKERRLEIIQGKAAAFMANAFTSTCLPGATPWVSGDTKIIYFEAYGRKIREISGCEAEDEFLIPPCQVQYFHYADEKGTPTYHARLVNAPHGLNDKQSGRVAPVPYKRFFFF